MTTPDNQRPRRAAHFSTPAAQPGQAPQPTPRQHVAVPQAVQGQARTGAPASRPASQRPASHAAERTARASEAQRPATPLGKAASPRRAPAAQQRAGAAQNPFSKSSALTTNHISGRTAQATRRVKNHDVRRENTKKQSRAPFFAVGLAAVILVVAVVLIVVPALTSSNSDTQDVTVGQTVSVSIPDGSGANAVAQALFDAKAISSKSEFLKTLSRMGADASIKSGTYNITVGNDMNALVTLLMSGPNAGGLTLTIPEGYTVARVAAAVEQTLGIPADDFIAQAKASNYVSDYDFLEGASNDSLEGFLFPKTYSFTEGATADDVIKAMLNQFRTEVSQLDMSYPESQGLTIAQTVNLASIVEKESTDDTREQVAAVFYNRLGNSGDPNYGFLQSDATTAYSVGHDPTAAEVHDESDPYSTYTHKGLPPTPICCPGLAALQAVCSPDQTALSEKDYYFYFWTDANGATQYKFSKTYDEHMQAIADASK